MTNELRDLIVEKLSAAADPTFHGNYFYETGQNSYLLGTVIEECGLLSEIPCEEFRDFDCNCRTCGKMLSVTDWPSVDSMTKAATCRLLDWKPRVDVFDGDIRQYRLCEKKFVEKIAEAAGALGRIRRCEGYWDCGNVRPPRNAKPRPFFVCMDPDRAELGRIDLSLRPILLVVADKRPAVGIQTLRFDASVDMDFGDWHIDSGFFVDDGLRKGKEDRIGDMTANEFWEKSKSIVAEVSREEREYIAAEIKKLKPFMPRARKSVLRQEDVAKDFGVIRQTVVDWEREQTVDGPENTSNPFHYYKSLRTNPDLRNAYELLAASAKAYNKMKEEAKKSGKRFRMAFESFNEMWLKHNNGRNRHLG